MRLFKKKASETPCAERRREEEVVVFDSSDDEDVEVVYVDEEGNPVDADGNPLDEEGNPLVEEEPAPLEAAADAASQVEGEEAGAADDEDVEVVYVDEDGNPVDADGNPLPAEDEVVYVDEEGNPVDWESLSEEERAAFDLVEVEEPSEGKKTYDRVQRTTEDLNAIAKEGIQTARELKGVVDDLQGMFDFKNWGK